MTWPRPEAGRSAGNHRWCRRDHGDGRRQIYAQAMVHASRLYLTEVAVELDGDAHFPALDMSEWEERQRLPGSPGEGQPAYDFVSYRRRGLPEADD